VFVFEEPIAELSATAVCPTTRPAVVWAPIRAAKDLRDTPWYYRDTFTRDLR